MRVCRGALDIFSQFFVSPLFSESSTGRELLAVDSEDSKNRTNDSRRILQVGYNRARLFVFALFVPPSSVVCCRVSPGVVWRFGCWSLGGILAPAHLEQMTMRSITGSEAGRGME